LGNEFEIGGCLHHQYPKSQPLSGWDFFVWSASVGAVFGLGLLSAPLLKSPFQARIPPFFSLCSLVIS
jgi:hypothetical protein